VSTVLKLGGELLEDAAAVRASAAAIVRLAGREPVVVVHGGGRAIDAELKTRGLTPRFVDGLRVTDEAALESVVSVLAGRTNTSLVAAIGALGGKAVGLTGADAKIGLAVKAAPLATISGERVDLGLVGEPGGGNVELLADLLRLGYVPVVASVGVAADGTLLNVNADVFAAHLAAALRARRLIVAGTTPGVLDSAGATIQQLTEADVRQLTASGTAHSGMVAKLNACRHALGGGVSEVAIVAGRGVQDFDSAVGTKVLSGV
jgi:acetylglutamate kinase